MTRILSVPPLGVDFPSSKPTLEALIEAVETGQRVRKDILNSYIKVSDLVDLDILRLAANGKALLQFQPEFLVPTLLNGWVNYNVAYLPAGFYKDAFGRVQLRGMIRSGSIGAFTAFTLPAGYRPSHSSVHGTVSNDAFGVCYILASGVVQAAVGSNTWFSLNGISFLAVQ